MSYAPDNSNDRPPVLITGSSGRIGSRLAERLVKGYRVVGLDRRPHHCAPAAVLCLQMDLTDEASVREALDQVAARWGARIASVVHLAGYYDFVEARDPRHEEVNVRGTARLLHALRDFQVEQFLFASTMLVHRPCAPGERIREDSPLDDRDDWDYPASKARAESLLQTAHGSVPLVIARIGAVYDDGGHLIPLARQIQRVFERQWVGRLFPGSADRGMTYLHLEDLVDALVRVIDRRSSLTPESTLLLGEPEHVSYGELQEELGRLIHGQEWETTWVPPAVARVGAWVQERFAGEETPFIRPWMIGRADDHYALDSSRARELLDWHPRHSLRTTLPDIVADLKADPDQWYEANGLAPESRAA